MVEKSGDLNEQLVVLHFDHFSPCPFSEASHETHSPFVVLVVEEHYTDDMVFRRMNVPWAHFATMFLD